MKVILTGASGWIGGEALKRCIRDNRIKQVIILVRRVPPTLPNSTKVKTIIIKDFNNYDSDTLFEIEGADACIWALGTKFSGDPVVEVEYPTTFYKAITSSKSFKNRTTPFRFSYLGGAFTETDQSKWLWWLSHPRKSRGLAQTRVLSFAEAEGMKGNWETYVARPGGVLPAWNDANLLEKFVGWFTGSGLSAWNDELGVVLVKMALEGGSEAVISSARVAEIARQTTDT